MGTAVLLVLIGGVLAQPEVGSARWTPSEVWAGYDPEALPLEIEVLRAWDEDEGAYEKLTFLGERSERFGTRIFGYRGLPRMGTGRAGVLHIHGGGQTASLDWVRFWAKRGYAAVSFDFCGPWEGRTEFTDWGPIEHANMRAARGGFQVRPTPRESAWFHWAVASRRALTLLASDARVDRERLGVFGISVGGTLTWMVAGSDARVKAAAPIYGCGYNVDRRKVRWGLPEPSGDQLEYKRALSPEAHAPYLRCPLLFLNATNDFHGALEDGFDTLGAVPRPTWQAFTPRFNHHLEPDVGANLPRWMDWQLRGGKPFPRSPNLALELDAQGLVRATVTAGPDATVRSARFYYALGDKLPQNRFWRETLLETGGAGLEATLDVMDIWEPVHAIANLTFAAGETLSTNLARIIPGQLGAARARLEPSRAMEADLGRFASWVFVPAYTDPVRAERYFRDEESWRKEGQLTLDPALFSDPARFHIGSHIVGDPQFAGQGNDELAFEVKGAFTDEGITARVIEKDWTPAAKRYVTRITGKELSMDWREVRLGRERFKTEAGETLDDWSRIDKLELVGATAKAGMPAFRRLRWVETGAER